MIGIGDRTVGTDQEEEEHLGILGQHVLPTFCEKEVFLLKRSRIRGIGTATQKSHPEEEGVPHGFTRYSKAAPSPAVLKISSSLPRSGESRQAGSVRAGSPERIAAWQRQPPKSTPRSGQERHGSGIQSVPLNRLKASDPSQMSRSDRRRTLSNRSEGISRAVGQGRTSPLGLTVRYRLPQPFMHGLGRSPK